MKEVLIFVLHAAFPVEHGGHTLIAAYDTAGDCQAIADSLSAVSRDTPYWCEEQAYTPDR